jgi:hypothetical protein
MLTRVVGGGGVAAEAASAQKRATADEAAILITERETPESCNRKRDHKNSPSRLRFRPLNRLTFGLHLQSYGSVSIYLRSVLGASGNLWEPGGAMQVPAHRKFAHFARSENSGQTNFSQRAKISSRRTRRSGDARTTGHRRRWRAPPRSRSCSVASTHRSDPTRPTSPSASPRACSRSRRPSRERRFACSALP